MRRAKGALSEAEDAAKEAAQKKVKAEEALEAAEGELKSLREEVCDQEEEVEAPEEGPTANVLVHEVKRLLETLESSGLVKSGTLQTPQPVLERVSALRTALNTFAPQVEEEFTLDDGVQKVGFTTDQRRSRAERSDSEPPSSRLRKNSASRTPPPTARR